MFGSLLAVAAPGALLELRRGDEMVGRPDESFVGSEGKMLGAGRRAEMGVWPAALFGMEVLGRVLRANLLGVENERIAETLKPAEQAEHARNRAGALQLHGGELFVGRARG